MKDVEISLGNRIFFLSTDADASSVGLLDEEYDFAEVCVTATLEFSIGDLKPFDYLIERGNDGNWSINDTDSENSPFDDTDTFSENDLKTLRSVSIALAKAEMEQFLNI